MYEHLLYDSEDGVTTITLNRPDKRNAINTLLAEELEAAWVAFDKGEDRVAILTGSGPSFTAGADLNDVPSRGYGYVPGIGVAVSKPVICAVQGWCVGVGLILVMQADLCIASHSARFYYPEAKLGLGRGLMASIVGRIPHKVAAELMLVAEPITAQRMEHHGLVNRLVSEDEVMGEAKRMAAIMADRESVVNEFYKYSIEWMLPKGPGEISEHTRWLSNQLPGHRNA